jgi:hypothetical protein
MPHDKCGCGRPAYVDGQCRSCYMRAYRARKRLDQEAAPAPRVRGDDLIARARVGDLRDRDDLNLARFLAERGWRPSVEWPGGCLEIEDPNEPGEFCWLDPETGLRSGLWAAAQIEAARSSQDSKLGGGEHFERPRC